MKRIETERLILRNWSIDDLDDFYEYAKSKNIGPSAGWKPHSNKEESKKILMSFIKADETWAIEYKENSKVIGSIGLHKDDMRTGVNSKMLGYVLSEDYWGHGLITEASKAIINFAFNELNLDVLSVYHFRFNQKSKRVIEKCSFKYEGTLRRGNKLFDGTVVDLVCYSMLKEEYYNK